ncbi:hypothetical protein CEXT_13871, partial [Caerostris extrusa]
PFPGDRTGLPMAGLNSIQEPPLNLRVQC